MSLDLTSHHNDILVYALIVRRALLVIQSLLQLVVQDQQRVLPLRLAKPGVWHATHERSRRRNASSNDEFWPPSRRSRTGAGSWVGTGAPEQLNGWDPVPVSRTGERLLCLLARC